MPVNEEQGEERTEVFLHADRKRRDRHRRSPRLDLHRPTRIYPTDPRSSSRLIEPRGRTVVLVELDIVRCLLEQVCFRELGIKVGDALVRVDVGLEGGWDLASGKGVPVDRLEEGVLFELSGVAGGAKAVLGVAVEKLEQGLVSVQRARNGEGEGNARL